MRLDAINVGLSCILQSENIIVETAQVECVLLLLLCKRLKEIVAYMATVI